MRSALLVTLLVAVAAAPAHAAVDVAWDCFVQTGPVSCTNLENAFFSNKMYARQKSDAPSAAALEVHIRAIALATATRYELGFAWQGRTSSFDESVPQEFSSDAVLLRLVGDIEKCSAPLFSMDEPATVDDDGVMHLALRDPSQGPRKARSDDETTGWYIAPSLGMNGDRYGVLELHGQGGLEINYSNPLIRAHGYSWSGYRFVHTDDTTFEPKDRTYQNFDVGTSWVLARSIWKGLSISGQSDVESEPQNNDVLRANAYVGIEWVLVPFLKTDEGNIGVQYVLGAEHEDFVYETVLKKKELDWLRQRFTVSGTWHFQQVDVNGSATYAGMVNNLHFTAFSGSAGLTWHLLEDLSLQAGGDVSYRLGLVNEPKDPLQEPPLAQFYGGSAYGDVTFDFNVSLQYVFGNSLLLHQDQRWK